jgi:hypothetical protein
MKKVLILSVAALVIAGCSDDKERQYQQQMQAQRQIIEQQQYAQPQYAQPQYAPQVVQPQIIQAPAQPVVVPQHDNTLTNMALGAVIGHTIANMGSNNNNDSRSVERIEHKTVIIDNRYPSAPVQPIAPSQPVSAPVQPKTSSMDMNKLSESAKQTLNTSTPTVKTSSMDMSRLSSRPSVSLAKPFSSMNMSKLGKR